MTIFISYSHQDSDLATNIEFALKRIGHHPFRDERLSAGDDFPHVLEREIRRAHTVLVLWTRHSVRSKWVAEEASLAARMGTLCPVSIGVSPPFGFTTIHTPSVSPRATATDVLWAVGLSQAPPPPKPIRAEPSLDDWWTDGPASKLRGLFGHRGGLI